MAVDGAEIAAPSAHFVPDAHAVLPEIGDVGLALRNHRSSWITDFMWTFLVVTSGKPSVRSKRI